MGPKLRARLANISGLSADELQVLIDDLTAAFDVLDDSGGSLEDLNEIVEAIDTVRGELSSRGDRQGLRDRVHATAQDEPTVTDPEGDDDEDDDDDEDEDDEGANSGSDDAHTQRIKEGKLVDSDDDEEQATDTGRPSLEAVAAAGNRRRNPRPSNLRVATRLLAAGDVSGFSTGQEITDKRQLAIAMARRLESLGARGNGDRVPVATLIKDYPEERQLGEDPFRNSELIEAALAPQAMVASGGICEPVTVDFAVSTIGSTSRPLQAGLPSFNATRGGVKFNVPPSLADVVGVPETWSIADDEAAETDDQVRKTCFRVECGTSDDAFVYGVPVCLEIGNFMGRFTPEWITAQQDLLDVATARMAELELLKLIDADSTATTSAGVLGAVRDILTTLDRLNAAYRYRHRLDNATLRNVLPVWVRDMMRADLAMELAHNRSGDNNLALADAAINGFFSSRNLNPIWMLEDAAGAMGAAQGAGAILDFPQTFVMYVFAEGTFQYLDGGRIDVGVVRDSTLNSKNDYQIWREDFEGVAKRGNESLKVTVTTKETGMSAGTKDTTAA
jgi:hypothetical protein